MSQQRNITATRMPAGLVPNRGGAKYPLAKRHLDGLTVLEDVPNLGSIAASLSNYTTLPGIRIVRMSAFETTTKQGEKVPKRVKDLAARIKRTKTISPLIVVDDGDPRGPYILEGAHRFDALGHLGKVKFPAVVVKEHTANPAVAKFRTAFDSADHVWELTHPELKRVLQDAPKRTEDEDYDWDKYAQFVTELFPEYVLVEGESDGEEYMITSAVKEAVDHDPDSLALYFKPHKHSDLLLKMHHARIAHQISDEFGRGGSERSRAIFKSLENSEYDALPEIPLGALQKLEAKQSLEAADWSIRATDPFERNKQRFGVTEDLALAFYLLPDGTMLDGGGEGYGRAYDHRNIDYGGGGTRGMQEFMSIGAIRLMPETPSLDIMVEPTSAQYYTLGDWIRHFESKEIVLELEDGLGDYNERDEVYYRASRRYDESFDTWTQPQKILNKIRRFYSEKNPMALAVLNPHSSWVKARRINPMALAVLNQSTREIAAAAAAMQNPMALAVLNPSADPDYVSSWELLAPDTTLLCTMTRVKLKMAWARAAKLEKEIGGEVAIQELS